MRKHPAHKGPDGPRLGCGEQPAGGAGWSASPCESCAWSTAMGLHRREDQPREREPFGSLHSLLRTRLCGRAEVAGLGPCNPHLVLLQWIFHFFVLFLLVNFCCLLSFVLPVWHLCLAEVLLFIHLVFCESKGQILLARVWGRVTRVCAGVPTFVCLSSTSPFLFKAWPSLM